MHKLLERSWSSPTITTWMSYLAQTAGLVLVLPLVLRNFSDAETSVWFLFSSFIALQSLADFGFKNTFSRSVSFAMGGAEKIIIYKSEENNYSNKKTVNWELIENIIVTSKTVYLRLSGLVFFLMATLGTLALYKPISLLEQINWALGAWGIIVIVSTIRFYGNIYLVYLEGTNQIPLFKRWETLTFLGGVLTSFIVLLANGGLFELVLANQVWVLIAVIRNKFLCDFIFENRFKKFAKEIHIDKEIFSSIWPAAWRSGIAGLMNFGVVNLSGILYAQIGEVKSVSSYLLAIRLLNAIRGFSMAPFYSQLPRYSRLRAEGKIKELIRSCQKGMKLAHLVFIVIVIVVSVSANSLLNLISSKTAFVAPLLWILLSFAYLFQRYGAMHMQLYLTTHHVIAHIADSTAGMIFLVSSLILINFIGVYAFPIGMILGYLGFYSWYSAKYSLRSIKMNFWNFEKDVLSIPAIILLCYIALRVIYEFIK